MPMSAPVSLHVNLLARYTQTATGVHHFQISKSTNWMHPNPLSILTTQRRCVLLEVRHRTTAREARGLIKTGRNPNRHLLDQCIQSGN